MSFSTRRAASAAGLTERQVRGYVRAGLLRPTRGPRGAFRFSFQDVVVLRTGRALNEGGISTRAVRRAMARLREIPSSRGLSAVNLRADGGRVVVTKGGALWDAHTDQLCLSLGVKADGVGISAPFPAGEAREEARPTAQHDGEWWFAEGIRLEDDDVAGARAAYREAIAHDPGHASAHANLGRILHEQGDLASAEDHYRRALLAEPGNPTAAYNLGVVREDLGDVEGALEAYRKALEGDSGLAAAHFNAGRLLEAGGRRAEALGHFAAYRRMEEGR